MWPLNADVAASSHRRMDMVPSMSPLSWTDGSQEAFYPQDMYQKILAPENDEYKQSPADSRHFRVFSESQVHEAMVRRFHPGLQADYGPAEYTEYPSQYPEYPEYPEYNEFTTKFQNCEGFQNYSQKTQSSEFSPCLKSTEYSEYMEGSGSHESVSSHGSLGGWTWGAERDSGYQDPQSHSLPCDLLEPSQGIAGIAKEKKTFGHVTGNLNPKAREARAARAARDGALDLPTVLQAGRVHRISAMPVQPMPQPSVSQVTELLPFGLLDSPVNSPTSSIHPELEDENCGPNVANENEEPKARRQKAILEDKRLPREYHHSRVPKNVNFQEECESHPAQEITTLMIRNIPNRYIQQELIAELEDLGFAGTFNFLYIPLDKGTMSNVGYAFVNFVTKGWASKCIEAFQGYRFKRHRKTSGKIAAISAAHLQGLEANLAHYEKSAVNTAKLKHRRPVVMANISTIGDM